MKKNRMMRLASILLVCVLMTTSVISGTFAKYVTTDSATDTARVAKWGVAVSINGNLFGTDYADVSVTDKSDSIVATSTNVSSSNSTNIVAPGTKNDVGLKIALTGKPEVAYTISANNAEITAEEIFLGAGTWGVLVPTHGLNEDTDFVNNTYYYPSAENVYTKETAFVSTRTYYELIDEVTIAEDYYPMDWTVTAKVAGSTAFANITATRLADIQAAMIADLTKSAAIAANTDTSGSYTLTWKWDFEDTATNNGADTILGNLMANNPNAIVVAQKNDTSSYTSALTDGVSYNLENKFGISVTVTQVD